MQVLYLRQESYHKFPFRRQALRATSVPIDDPARDIDQPSRVMSRCRYKTKGRGELLSTCTEP